MPGSQSARLRQYPEGKFSSWCLVLDWPMSSSFAECNGVLRLSCDCDRVAPFSPSREPSKYIYVCKRSQEGWERISHGTGTGYSTIAAFWIPDKLPPPPPEKPKGGHARGGGQASAKLKTHAAFGGKGKRASSRPSKRASAKSGDGGSGPPEVSFSAMMTFSTVCLLCPHEKPCCAAAEKELPPNLSAPPQGPPR